MNLIKFSSLTRLLAVSAFVFGFFALGVFAQGSWTSPTTPPPGGNVAAPINTGLNLQEKLGALIIRSGLWVDGNFVVATGTSGGVRGKVLTAVDDSGTVGWGTPAAQGGSGNFTITSGYCGDGATCDLGVQTFCSLTSYYYPRDGRGGVSISQNASGRWSAQSSCSKGCAGASWSCFKAD